MRIDFHPLATAEVEQSADWYAERSIDSVRAFATAVDTALQEIEKQPERFPRFDGQHRYCNLILFPFQIVYRRRRIVSSSSRLLTRKDSQVTGVIEVSPAAASLTRLAAAVDALVHRVAAAGEWAFGRVVGEGQQHHLELGIAVVGVVDE